MLGCETQDEFVLPKHERLWIKIHIDQASLIIDALRQRWETLRRIGEFLIEYQMDFLNYGPLYLKPLTRVVVAQNLNIHESTVSRAVSNKLIQLPDGRLNPLSSFFDSSLAAKEAIRFLIRDNAKRLCDREIAEGLQAKGMNLSRRTVTKYRQEINLDPSRRQSVRI
jgi:RNA polymerase sigma-54 factor